MRRYPDITSSSPNTADSPMRQALLAAVKTYHPEHRAWGDRACATEEKARAGLLHLARPLDLIVQRGVRIHAPLYGPTGAMQLASAVRWGILATYNALPTEIDVQAASEAETAPDGAVDARQARRADQMNSGQLREWSAHIREQIDRLETLDAAVLRRAHALETEVAAMDRRLGALRAG